MVHAFPECEPFLQLSHYWLYTLKKAGLFQPNLGSNMDKPKLWIKNAI